MKYLNALNKIPGLGPKTLEKLANFFPSFEEAWKSDQEALLLSGLGEKLVAKFILERKSLDPEAEWERLEKENVRMISKNSSDFPALLKEIPTCPFVLYYKGNISILNEYPAIAIVGSRKYSRYGEQASLKLSSDLAQAGITIISGLALGIDAIAHAGTLGASGRTVAVLGNSLDEKNIYPRYNVNLSREIIASGGALISEYPIETPAGNFTFPSRNRLIAGMTLGTLVIEAGEKSGSLITAELALEFNREVFAVPGDIFSPGSVGANSLIRKGAKLVSCSEDILEEIGLFERQKNIPGGTYRPENEIEREILKVLTHEPVHIDKLARMTKLKTMAVASTLSMLEIKGIAKNVGGQNYIII
ncbi:MAG: DNA-processing protein DprA [Patescibacteria group bacterium]